MPPTPGRYLHWFHSVALWRGDPRLLTGASMRWCRSLIKQVSSKHNDYGKNTSGILVRPRVKMRNRSILNSHDLEIHCLLTPCPFRCIPWASLTHSLVPLDFEMPNISSCILRSNLKASTNPIFCFRQ